MWALAAVGGGHGARQRQLIPVLGVFRVVDTGLLRSLKVLQKLKTEENYM